MWPSNNKFYSQSRKETKYKMCTLVMTVMKNQKINMLLSSYCDSVYYLFYTTETTHFVIGIPVLFSESDRLAQVEKIFISLSLSFDTFSTYDLYAITLNTPITLYTY